MPQESQFGSGRSAVHYYVNYFTVLYTDRKSVAEKSQNICSKENCCDSSLNIHSREVIVRLTEFRAPFLMIRAFSHVFTLECFH